MEYKDINVRVYVTGEAQAKEITPASGTHAGEQTTVLNFRAVEPRYKKYPDGRRERQEGIFYSVRYFELNAKEMADLIKDGMLLEIKGSFYEREYTNQEGEKRTDNVINAKKISLPLEQSGIKSIVFEKRETKKAG